MLVVVLILAVTLHVAQPACSPLVSPQSLDQYTVGITCLY